MRKTDWWSSSKAALRSAAAGLPLARIKQAPPERAIGEEQGIIIDPRHLLCCDAELLLGAAIALRTFRTSTLTSRVERS
jgi:hypothetical protein